MQATFPIGAITCLNVHENAKACGGEPQAFFVGNVDLGDVD